MGRSNVYSSDEELGGKRTTQCVLALLSRCKYIYLCLGFVNSPKSLSHQSLYTKETATQCVLALLSRCKYINLCPGFVNSPKSLSHQSLLH